MKIFYPVSAVRTALTVILTTSVLLACNNVQQDKQQQYYETGSLARPDSLASSSARVNVARQKSAKAGVIAAASVQGAAYSSYALPTVSVQDEIGDDENYKHFDGASIKRVVETPVSTFSIDVDTGAYSNVRRMINAGTLPRHDAVRIEEMLNYFSYDYPVSENDETPFSVTTEIGVTPWNPDTRLLHIGIRGYDVSAEDLPASNLVFLVDVSGSMNSPDKLGLLKSALRLLSGQMRSEDRVSIVVYAGASGVVLEPVAGDQSAKIAQALANLSAGGSTNGAAGIRSAYLLAEQAFIKDGINRVILATDGDFNVGTTDFEALKELVAEKRKTGISLTTLGFGTGNYNDYLMEQLADAGNGNYSYIDTLNEAQKVLVDERSSTLKTIARDVKIQIEFNPAVVAEYRLIGYENQMLNREDFNNDKVDAGEIGAGHTVTALYEITLTDSDSRAIDALRYEKQLGAAVSHTDEVANLRLRYKAPAASRSKLIEQLIKTSDIKNHLADSSKRYRFSAAVAGFGQLLRGGRYSKKFTYADVLELARQARGKDAYGYRGEFISLVNLAGSLSSQLEGGVQAAR